MCGDPRNKNLINPSLFLDRSEIEHGRPVKHICPNHIIPHRQHKPSNAIPDLLGEEDPEKPQPATEVEH